MRATRNLLGSHPPRAVALLGQGARVAPTRASKHIQLGRVGHIGRRAQTQVTRCFGVSMRGVRFGDRGGRRTQLIPSRSRMSRDAGENLPSRSMSTYRLPLRKPSSASVSCAPGFGQGISISGTPISLLQSPDRRDSTVDSSLGTCVAAAGLRLEDSSAHCSRRPRSGCSPGLCCGSSCRHSFP